MADRRDFVDRGERPVCCGVRCWALGITASGRRRFKCRVCSGTKIVDPPLPREARLRPDPHRPTCCGVPCRIEQAGGIYACITCGRQQYGLDREGVPVRPKGRPQTHPTATCPRCGRQGRAHGRFGTPPRPQFYCAPKKGGCGRTWAPVPAKGGIHAA